MSAKLLFEDIFEVHKLDPDGKKFERVSRIVAKGVQFEMDLRLDVNTDLYPIKVEEKYYVALNPTLSPDGTPDSGVFDQTARKSLADKYEYVMYGKLFKLTSTETEQEAFLSFGGLLMSLKGHPKDFKGLELDSRLYLLMRKVT